MTEYSRQTEYFLYDDGQLNAANRRRFERTFPSIRDDIRNFVAENKTDFDNMDDLKTLLRFCVEKTSQ